MGDVDISYSYQWCVSVLRFENEEFEAPLSLGRVESIN